MRPFRCSCVLDLNGVILFDEPGQFEMFETAVVGFQFPQTGDCGGEREEVDGGQHSD